jgi:hypothetical protein
MERMVCAIRSVPWTDMEHTQCEHRGLCDDYGKTFFPSWAVLMEKGNIVELEFLIASPVTPFVSG